MELARFIREGSRYLDPSSAFTPGDDGSRFRDRFDLLARSLGVDVRGVEVLRGPGSVSFFSPARGGRVSISRVVRTGTPDFDATVLHELGHLAQWRDGLLGWDGRHPYWEGRRVGEVAHGNLESHASLPWERDAWRRAVRSPLFPDPRLLGFVYRRSLEIALEDSK